MKYGLDRMGKKFVNDFIQTTDQVPVHLLFNDYKRGTGDSSLKIDELINSFV
jgi:hypothetical protein